MTDAPTQTIVVDQLLARAWYRARACADQYLDEVYCILRWRIVLFASDTGRIYYHCSRPAGEALCLGREKAANS